MDTGAPGLTVDRYRLVSKLGEGGMGSVWKAQDTLLGRDVALKFLSDRFVDSEEARRRFLREARAACALHHPGIATVHDAGETGDRIWIAFHLVDGETIAERLAREGPFAVSEAVRIAIEAAEALGHAHGRGVLHRDVSARNLMLDRDGRVVIVDFGLALPEDTTRITRTGTGMGTAAYLAPEVIQGEPADARSDLYALGVVLYEMLTGTTPFAGERVETMLYAAVHEAPRAPSRRRPELPTEVDAIVLRALAKDPAERFLSMEELASALQRSAIGATWATPRSRSRLRRITIAVVAGLVVLSGVAWLVVRYVAPGAVGPSRYDSVAILPLRIRGPDPAANTHLAEGIAEALATKLTQMAGLHVTPWTTSRRHADSEAEVAEIARRLAVDALLTGALMFEGRRIRGTVTLVDGTSGLQVWADDFDEPVADLFEVQESIAKGVATRLLGQLTGDQVRSLARPIARDVGAYEWYLKGVAAFQRSDPESVDLAMDYFLQAVKLDEEYASAWVGIGSVHFQRFYFGWEGGLETLAEAQASFERALELQPDLVAARRALIRVFYERGRSEDMLAQGKLGEAPGDGRVETLLLRAEAYMYGGLESKATPLLEEALRVDPDNAGALWHLGLVRVWIGDFRLGVRIAQRYLDIHGDDFETHFWKAMAHHAMGELERAREHYEAYLEHMPPETLPYQGWWAPIFFRQVGESDRADQLLLDGIDVAESKLETNPDHPRLRTALASFYGLLGDVDRMTEEEARLVRDVPDCGMNLSELAYTYAALGDRRGFLELLDLQIKKGFIEHSWRPLLGALGQPDIAEWEGAADVLREHEAATKRLDALY